MLQTSDTTPRKSDDGRRNRHLCNVQDLSNSFNLIPQETCSRSVAPRCFQLTEFSSGWRGNAV